MLTMNEDDETILSALRAGASGYLLKGSGADEVHNAIRAAAGGGMVFGATLAGKVAGYFARASAPAPEAAPAPAANTNIGAGNANAVAPAANAAPANRPAAPANANAARPAANANR